MIIKRYELTALLFMTSDNTCVIGFFNLRMKILCYQKQKVDKINMCQLPTHQVNVSRKEVLCSPDSGKFYETPCIACTLRLLLFVQRSFPEIFFKLWELFTCDLP